MSFSREMSGRVPYWNAHAVYPCPSGYHAQTCTGDLLTIAVRISECNRRRFVDAEYANDPAVATCTAIRDTHFRVMLFRAETEKEINVVIQKISGSDLIFEEEYIALMNAAMFGEIMPRDDELYPELKQPPPEDKLGANHRNNISPVDHKEIR